MGTCPDSHNGILRSHKEIREKIVGQVEINRTAVSSYNRPVWLVKKTDGNW